ncbi:MAG: cytochrome c3 family protein [Acidobacteriota bacterium]
MPGTSGRKRRGRAGRSRDALIGLKNSDRLRLLMRVGLREAGWGRTGCGESRLAHRVIICAAFCIAFLWAGEMGRAQDAETCLECHGDETLKGTRDGREISVFVDIKQHRDSVHRDMECVACHQDIENAEFPHAEDLKRVDCGICHENEQKEVTQTVHGKAAARGDKLAPRCTDCHGTHHILPRSDPRSPTSTMNVPATCGRCHHEGSPVSLTHHIPQDRILENYSESIHGEGLFKKGLTVTAVCTSCHESHRILPSTDPQSSVNRRNVARTCTRCHARIEDVHQKVVEGRLWEEEPHKIPVCSECHSPHKVRKVVSTLRMANEDCLMCHGKPDLAVVRNGEKVSLYVDRQVYAASMHAGTACAQCHTEVVESRHRPCETIRSKVDCSVCHAEQVNTYRGSTHGTLAAKGDPDAPSCLDCHDRHYTKSRLLPSSPTYPRNVPDLCARCHRAGEKAAVRIKSDVPDIVRSYQMSIHGVGLVQSGLVVTATCADCHTAHGELPPSDPRSTVYPSRIADTCGRCHRGIEEVFKNSVHWPGNTTTDKKLPTCEDCHSSHSIKRTDRPDFRFEMMSQCGNCHRTEANTFFETYHGKVTRLGSAGAAKCYDCHGTHDILPTTDPHSRLSRQNVVATCAQCHPGAHRRFAGYLTHATHHERKKYPYLFYSFWGMTILLAGTLTFALIHTFAWLWRLWRSRAQWLPHKETATTVVVCHRRFTSLERALHLTMLISFFTLALSGMSLKFSFMPWALRLSHILGGFDSMGGLHRIAAVTLLTVFAIHLWDLRRKRKESKLGWFRYLTNPDSMLFNLNDLRELWGSIKWFLGLGPRPRYGRYTYWEKFDYFAVFWGVFVIGSTGLILWFPEFFTRILPGLAINVATIIHSDEALLAVAFIFTVHFFNTHFRPDKFPMDTVIFTCCVPMDELKYDKPREYDKISAEGEEAERIVRPLPRAVERGFRAFGFVALAVGITLIVLIVYTMLVGYR